MVVMDPVAVGIVGVDVRRLVYSACIGATTGLGKSTRAIECCSVCKLFVAVVGVRNDSCE
jgi:hypothetical protein